MLSTKLQLQGLEGHRKAFTALGSKANLGCRALVTVSRLHDIDECGVQYCGVTLDKMFHLQNMSYCLLNIEAEFASCAEHGPMLWARRGW